MKTCVLQQARTAASLPCSMSHGFQPMLVATVYLESGAPLTGHSAEVLAQVGERLSEFKGEFFLGGDFNCVPSVFLRSNAATLLQAKVVAPVSDTGTCKDKFGRSRVIDHFVVSSGLKDAIDSVSIIEA